MINLNDTFQRIFELLKQIQPDPDEYDVMWHGPYYIPRPREWRRTGFMLYRGTLYASVLIDGSWHGLNWTLATGRTADERGSIHHLQQEIWADVLGQIEHRLTSALGNFDAYNQRVERLLPPAYRTGRIVRRLTWPPGSAPPLSTTEVAEVGRALTAAVSVPDLPEMSLGQYLRAAAVAYDASFPELRDLSPLQKYQRRADGRHDGLLDLDPDAPRAFAEWFSDPAFRGGHPWEIVFGHPHGVMLYPRREASGWRLSLAVDSEGLYVTAARMAHALAAKGLPIEFTHWQRVVDALLGVDAVAVGPVWPALSYELLAETNPSAVDAIQWDPIPPLAPITPDQAARVAVVSLPDGVPG